MTAENILVTGAAGFIEKHLARLLAHEGSDVGACGLPSADLSWCKSLGVCTAAGNLMNRHFAYEVAHGIDGVFNPAAAFDLKLPLNELVRLNVAVARNIAVLHHRPALSHSFTTPPVTCSGLREGIQRARIRQKSRATPSPIQSF